MKAFRKGRHLLVAGLFVFFIGCEAGYYIHLIKGQTHLILNSQPIETLLSSSQIDNRTRQKLSFVDSIRSFAQSDLGLNVNSNYTCYYDTKGHPVSWNVSACPPHSFTPYKWSFPIVGAIPYKGFFDKKKAQNERDRLRDKGYDTILRPISAYSTLGFLSDPILSTMLDYREDRLIELILHELTHATLYLADHADFNESLATFIGREGTLILLKKRYGSKAPILTRIKQERQDTARFHSILLDVTASLDSLYNLELPKDEILTMRETIFRNAQLRYKSLRPQFLVSNYDYFLKWKVNNAQLMSYRRYNRDLDLFSSVYENNNRRLDLVIEHCQACSNSSDPWQCLRTLSSN